MPHIQRYLLTGVLTIIPIWITWLVFNFFLVQLSNIGKPWAQALSKAVQRSTPSFSDWLLDPWFQSALAILLTLVALYLLGWAATRVIGKRLIGLFDLVMNRIPVVQTVYGSIKKLVVVLQQKPDNIQRIVLINFPSPEMKTVGFVTCVMKDETSGKELAAVYVPTTPNPTSGYMEIVPLEQLTPTDWTMDEAMAFVMSAGAVAPEKVHYTKMPNEKE